MQILDRISRQFASADGQTSTNYTPPLPYPTFHPSASDYRVTILWLISLICSLSAAFLAALVQQWASDYMRVFTPPRKPLKTARIRMFLFERVERLPKVAEIVPGLIHFSLILFFWGIGDIILQINKTIFITTVVPILVGAFFYLYCVFAPMRNPQLPYRTPFSVYILNLIRNLRSLASMEIFQEDSAMKASKGRMNRDVRALQWLIDNINEVNEVQTFVLAFIDSFDEEWGRKVWRAVIGNDKTTPPVDQPPSRPSPREEATVYRLCRYVRLFLKKDRNSTDTDIRRRHSCECIETMASLVCLTDVKLGSFGDITEVLSEVGNNKQTNTPLTIRSNPLFAVRWTCLSLVAIRQIVSANRLQETTKFALDGIALFQTNIGSRDNVAKALTAAQKMDDYLKKAWAAVLDLRLALEPWSLNQNRTEFEIRGILNSREASIHELEGIAMEAADLEEVDLRTHLLQEKMDEVTHKLIRRLPGVFFDKLQPTAPSMSEAFDLRSVKTTPIPPQLVFPGQQLQSLCILGRRLRDIITEGKDIEDSERNKSLEYLREVPIPLCGLNSVMKRQLWRLLDLRDGHGFGFTIELFFLALRQFSRTPSSSELEKALFIGTFNVISSNWKKSKNSTGTQRILVDLLCDLVIQSRGVFSDFSYPQYIVKEFLDLVGNIVRGHGSSQTLINDIIQELEDENLRHRMDNDLRGKVLRAIGLSFDTGHS